MMLPTDRAPATNSRSSDQEKILSNKIVLVTGGTSGIGLEAAKLFREEGATVIIVGQNPARLQSAASQLGDSVTVLRGDVSKPAEVESIIKQISEKFGRIDVLFANAWIGLTAPSEADTEDQIDRQFDVNFKVVFFYIQKAAPVLAKGGSIVVTTSFLNEVGAPGLSILSATKQPFVRLCGRWVRNLHRVAFA